ncbi:MAG: sensor histidine kinase [Treponemataceae bacterium]|nr:sensor histidine kinase [Treponemataceae bacterium]
MHYTLCDQIAEIAENAFDAAATEISIELVEDEKVAAVYVRDNGPGFNYKPFYTNGLKHPHRSAGLGLAFLEQTVEQTGGRWKIDSSENGTTVFMEFNLAHIDTPPLGDVPEMFRNLFVQNADEIQRTLTVHRVKQTAYCNTEYSVSSTQLEEALGTVSTAENLQLLLQYLQSQEYDG